MKRYNLLSELYMETLKEITSSSATWEAFLKCACRNYKCRFDEQVLIYAQRPTATAVLEFDRWGAIFNRSIIAGSKGIAVFDDSLSGRSRVKYYFDIADTHSSTNSRPVPLWEVSDSTAAIISKHLGVLYNFDASGLSLEEAIEKSSINIVNNHAVDYYNQISFFSANGISHETLSVQEFKDILKDSIVCCAKARCGLNQAFFSNNTIVKASSTVIANTLGIALSDGVELLLREVAEIVLNHEQSIENRPEICYSNIDTSSLNTERGLHDGTDLYNAGRIESPEPSSTSGGSHLSGQIRIDAEEFSRNSETSGIRDTPDFWPIESTSDGNRANSAKTTGLTTVADGRGRGNNRVAERDESNGVGRKNEQPAGSSRGNHSGGTDSVLDKKRTELPPLLSEKLILGVIANKANDLKASKAEVQSFFNSHSSIDEQTEFVKSVYPYRYTEIIVDGQRVGYKPEENGLLMWEGSYLSRTSESVFSWGLVAEWTADLINKNEYYINTDIKSPQKQSSQLSLFDFSEENSNGEQLTLFPRPQLSQQIVDESLCIGSNNADSRLIICGYFAKDKPLEENARFLREHYGTNGSGFYFNDRKISLWYNEDGLRIAEGTTADRPYATVITWTQAAKRIRELLDLGRYMPQSELDKVAEYEITHLAQDLAHMAKDFSEEAQAAGYMPTIRTALHARGGFPETEQQISELLKNPEMLRTIIEEWSTFVSAYQNNHNLLRFQIYRPKELLHKLTDLQREPLSFTAAENYDSNHHFFISTDEVDNLLRGGNGHTDYRLAVYSFYKNHVDRKEREDFLRNYHGEYSGSYDGNDAVNYQKGKGISFSHGNISSPYAKVELKWNQVEKRISTLISSDKFLSESDRAAMPKYERQQLARKVHRFFADVSEKYPRPYTYNSFSDYWEGVEEVAEQLVDRVQVQNIYENMMLPVWENTKPDDRHYGDRKKGLDAMRSYLGGTYSVFNAAHPQEPLQYSETIFDAFTPTPQQAVFDSLEKSGYLVSEETLNKGVEKYAAHSGLGRHEDIADFIKNELLSDESTPNLLDVNEEVLTKKETLLPPPKPKLERVVFSTLYPDVPKEQRHNFRITNMELGYGTPSEKFAANIAAIRCLKQIECEERLATPDEQLILSRYVGWGGLADCFDAQSSHYQDLKILLNEDEYTAARASSLTAFYTSPIIIKSMYQALSQMGFREGNILEPSCGVGNFIGLLPDNMAESKAYGVEIDPISGRIAAQLYQNSSISVNGFEKVQMPDSFFDVALGNVPFGDFKVLDKRYDKNSWLIHDYFFGKTLDKVRPGGVIAFVTSKGTLDKENPAVRKYIAQRANLIGAIRLPNNAFQKNAGTKVTSDIIFLQKRERVIDVEPDWVHLGITPDGLRVNDYFVQNPQMVLGELVLESTQFGMDVSCKAYENSDLSELLSTAISNLRAEIPASQLEETSDVKNDLSIPADPNVRNFSYAIVNGQIFFRENSRMYPVNLSSMSDNRVRGMIALRDCARKLIEYQTENYPDDAIAAEQQKLNQLYDSFTKNFGLINSRGNSLAFREDSSYFLLCSLEILDDEGQFKRKADMFTKRTIKSHVAVSSVETASEALAVSISEKAGVDLSYMSSLSGKSEQELEQELQGVIFRDISCSTNANDIPKAFMTLQNFPLVTADEYLSGNVRKKLQMAKALESVLPDDEKSKIQQHIEALTAVQPVDLTASEIAVRIGATWIPAAVYQQFMFELLEPSRIAKERMTILYSRATGQWHISNKNSDYASIKAFTTYGTKRVSAYQIFEDCLNLKDVRIFDKILEEGVEKRVLNKKETAIAQDRQELIKSQFKEWIWKDIDRREKLCKIYNDTFNSIRPREYDGKHIVFSGMNPEITLRKHQINAIAHVLYGGNTLLAHEVGAGKTFEMVASAMESKRLGLCSKSLVVVPNHITEQWATEWLQLYPSANILVATKKDFETKNRKKFCARIATGDYDAIIIGHSQFEKIPVSQERQRTIIKRQIDEVIYGLEEAKASRCERYTIKQMERTKKSLEIRLEKLNDQSRKDDVVTFEELGVDRIFVDESHYFKNLFLMTKMRNVGGIAQTEAQKSSDLFMKCQYLDELTGGKGIVFATGTPISNSMVELYTIQRYLQYATLQDMNLQHFDEWASTYGETVTAIELSPEGTGYRSKTRFAKFYNLPELMSVFKQVADIQTADTLHLPVPKAHFHTEVISPSDLQKEMVASLAERAELVRSGSVQPNVDNMLKITNDGRKLALDIRLLSPLSPDNDSSKVSVCSNNVYSIWERTQETRSAQLVFCDLSTPKGDGSFNVYDDLKIKLIQKGIPAHEIAFIHEANTEARKKELFGKVRSGQVRILMGSTQKMGAGTNVQDKLVALHDLDCPWRPSDLAQRLGRIVRQGNENEEVDIFRYVTEGTFDSYLYQLVENKQKFIAQIMTNKTPLRAADDVDETALSYAEIKALATGNPLIIEKCSLDMEVNKLATLKSYHLNQKYSLEEMIFRTYPATLKELSSVAAGLEADFALAQANPKNKEKFIGMTVFDVLYEEKEAAGNAILQACSHLQDKSPLVIGKYRGFDLTLSFDSFYQQYLLSAKNSLSHPATLGTDIYGNLIRLDNAIENIEKKLAETHEKIQNINEQLESAKSELAKPFDKEQELKEKTSRLNELNVLLAMNSKERIVLSEETPLENEEDISKKIERAKGLSSSLSGRAEQPELER